MTKKEAIKKLLQEQPQALLVDQELFQSPWDAYGKFILVKLNKSDEQSILIAARPIIELDEHAKIAYAYMIREGLDCLYIMGGARFRASEKIFYGDSMAFKSVEIPALETYLEYQKINDWSIDVNLENRNGNYSREYTLNEVIEKMNS